MQVHWLALALAFVPQVAFAKRVPAAPATPAVDLLALNTREVFHLKPDGRGRFGTAQLRGWNRFLRCHHTGRVHVISRRLAGLLYQTGRHFEGRRLLIVSGYRAPRIARDKGNPRSPHKLGRACDFRIEGVANSELRDYLRKQFAKVGVGYYPNSDFVHLDVRDQASAFWVDYSRPGERPRYVSYPDDERASLPGAPVKEEPGQNPGERWWMPGAPAPRDPVDGGGLPPWPAASLP